MAVEQIKTILEQTPVKIANVGLGTGVSAVSILTDYLNLGVVVGTIVYLTMVSWGAFESNIEKRRKRLKETK